MRYLELLALIAAPLLCVPRDTVVSEARHGNEPQARQRRRRDPRRDDAQMGGGQDGQRAAKGPDEIEVKGFAGIDRAEAVSSAAMKVYERQ
jgi:hypothetical protein